MYFRKTAACLAAMTLLAGLLPGCGTNDTTARQADQNTSNPDSAEVTQSPAPQPADDDSNLSTLPAFSAQDLDGNPITNEIFAQKDITIINIWGTFCSPCISEMPELGKWEKELPDHVQLVGLLCDVKIGDDLSEAQEIMKQAQAGFLNIVPDDALMNWLGQIFSVPTTILVDKTGTILGEPVVGADMQGYQDALEAALHENT